jgi:cysteine desulfurase
LLHVDAVHAIGKLAISMTEIGADSLSLSAHKIGGPQGAGALVLARDLPLRPLIFGGGQERGQRSGTENLAGIVGFGCAIELAAKEQAQTLETLQTRREQLLEGLTKIKGVSCLQFGAETSQQPSILSLMVSGAPAEVWLHHLDSRGVIVSVGSACQANKKEVSPVLFAAGLSIEESRRVLRLSLSGQTSQEEVQRSIEIMGEVASELATL